MRIAVIGGAGYIGSVLVPYLCYSGHDVTVYDRLDFGVEGLLSCLPHISLHEVDANNIKPNGLSLGSMSFDAVVNLAGRVGEPRCQLNIDDAIATNRDLPVKLLEMAPMLIHLSTASVYGASGGGHYLSETSPVRPIGIYAESKVQGEIGLVQAARNSGRVVLILRLGTVYGLAPRMRFDTLVNDCVRAVVRRQPMEFYGLDAYRPFLHLRSLCDAIGRILRTPPVGVFVGAPQIYNVANINISKAELMRMLTVPVTVVDKGDQRNYAITSMRFENHFTFPLSKTMEAFEIDFRQMVVAVGQMADPMSALYSNVEKK